MTRFRLIWTERGQESIELIVGLMPAALVPGVLLDLSRLRTYWPQMSIELDGRRVTRLEILPGATGQPRARVVARAAE